MADPAADTLEARRARVQQRADDVLAGARRSAPAKSARISPLATAKVAPQPQHVHTSPVRGHDTPRTSGTPQTGTPPHAHTEPLPSPLHPRERAAAMPVPTIPTVILGDFPSYNPHLQSPSPAPAPASLAAYGLHTSAAPAALGGGVGAVPLARPCPPAVPAAPTAYLHEPVVVPPAPAAAPAAAGPPDMRFHAAAAPTAPAAAPQRGGAAVAFSVHEASAPSLMAPGAGAVVPPQTIAQMIGGGCGRGPTAATGAAPSSAADAATPMMFKAPALDLASIDGIVSWARFVALGGLKVGESAIQTMTEVELRALIAKCHITDANETENIVGYWTKKVRRWAGDVRSTRRPAAATAAADVPEATIARDVPTPAPAAVPLSVAATAHVDAGKVAAAAAAAPPPVAVGCIVAPRPAPAATAPSVPSTAARMRHQRDLSPPSAPGVGLGAPVAAAAAAPHAPQAALSPLLCETTPYRGVDESPNLHRQLREMYYNTVVSTYGGTEAIEGSPASALAHFMPTPESQQHQHQQQPQPRTSPPPVLDTGRVDRPRSHAPVTAMTPPVGGGGGDGPRPRPLRPAHQPFYHTIDDYERAAPPPQPPAAAPHAGNQRSHSASSGRTPRAFQRVASHQPSDGTGARRSLSGPKQPPAQAAGPGGRRARAAAQNELAAKLLQRRSCSGPTGGARGVAARSSGCSPQRPGGVRGRQEHAKSAPRDAPRAQAARRSVSAHHAPPAMPVRLTRTASMRIEAQQAQGKPRTGEPQGNKSLTAGHKRPTPRAAAAAAPAAADAHDGLTAEARRLRALMDANDAGAAAAREGAARTTSPTPRVHLREGLGVGAGGQDAPAPGASPAVRIRWTKTHEKPAPSGNARGGARGAGAKRGAKHAPGAAAPATAEEKREKAQPPQRVPRDRDAGGGGAVAPAKGGSAAASAGKMARAASGSGAKCGSHGAHGAHTPSATAPHATTARKVAHPPLLSPAKVVAAKAAHVEETSAPAHDVSSACGSASARSLSDAPPKPAYVAIAKGAGGAAVRGAQAQPQRGPLAAHRLEMG